MRRALMRRMVALTLVLAGAVVFGACTSSMPLPTATPAAPGEMPASSPEAGAMVGTHPFPTGPAMLVEAGYTHPTDRVPSTGAHLPVNGKPTLVYVDAIW